ncbi:MAG: serine/threonine protein kinase, partial [Planctomycetia bacterium]
MMFSRGVMVCAVALTGAIGGGWSEAADWPDWRGPQQNRHYDGPPLVTSFDPEKDTNVVWKNDESGGISTPVIMGGKLFTLVRHKPGTQEEAEKVL